MAKQCIRCPGGIWICGTDPSCSDGPQAMVTSSSESLAGGAVQSTSTDPSGGMTQAATLAEAAPKARKWFEVGQIEITEPGTYFIKLSKQPSEKSQVLIEGPK